jgi:hypothetical protein
VLIPFVRNGILGGHKPPSHFSWYAAAGQFALGFEKFGQKGAVGLDDTSDSPFCGVCRYALTRSAENYSFTLLIDHSLKVTG